MGQTRLSRVDGQAGRLTLAGYPVETLAPAVSFEAAAFLLWHDRLPTRQEQASLRERLAATRVLPDNVIAALKSAVSVDASPMAALRLGIAALGLHDPGTETLLGATGAIVAAYARLRSGHEPVAPDPDHDHATSILAMLRGEAPSPAAARALATYLVTVCDHGMNASTFTARVVASTGSDLGATVEAALGALQGPLHGGAPGPALEALLELRDECSADPDGEDLDTRTRRWVREQVAAGERIMGFGHRVYRVRDPRADVLGAAAERLLEGSSLLADARIHEHAVLETLRELKPDRVLQTNVEFYTALLLHGLALPPDLFTAIFACGRVAGWLAHVAEQREDGRLIRPRAAYCGADDRTLPIASPPR